MTGDAALARVRSAVSPLVLVAIALAGVAVYDYAQGEYATAVALGVGAILTSLFVLLTRE